MDEEWNFRDELDHLVETDDMVLYTDEKVETSEIDEIFTNTDEIDEMYIDIDEIQEIIDD